MGQLRKDSVQDKEAFLVGKMKHARRLKEVRSTLHSTHRVISRVFATKCACFMINEVQGNLFVCTRICTLAIFMGLRNVLGVVL